VFVRVGVRGLGVRVGVFVRVGVRGDGVRVGVFVLVGVRGLGVRVGVFVGVGVRELGVRVGVFDGVGVRGSGVSVGGEVGTRQEFSSAAQAQTRRPAASPGRHVREQQLASSRQTNPPGRQALAAP
jgi:hypothetical protein